MGNNNSSNNKFISQHEYVFPPADMVYEEIDLPIIRSISMFLYLDHYTEVKNPCRFIWSVKNGVPYIKSFHLHHLRFSNQGDYIINANIVNNFSCKLSCLGEVIDDKELIVSTLNSYLDITSKKDETTLYVSIYEPSFEVIEIGMFVSEIWNIIWNKYRGEIPEDLGMIEWKRVRDDIFIDNIISKECTFNFGYLAVFSMITIEKTYNFFSDRIQISSRNMLLPRWTTGKRLHYLTDWIKRANRIYLCKTMYEDWIMETEVYSSLVQWLPEEMLEDTISLL